MQARPGDTCGKQGSRVALAEVRGTLRPDPGDERSGGRMHRGCSPTPALGPLACKAAKTQEGTVLFRPTICHFDDKASWPWVEDGTPGQTEEGGASLATGLFPASLHPSRPGLLPPLMGCGAWRLDERRSPPAVAHLRSPHRSAAEPPRPPLPEQALAPPRHGLVRAAGRAGPGGAGPGAGPGPGSAAPAEQGGLQSRGPLTAWGGAAGGGARWRPRVWVPRSYSWAPRPAPCARVSARRAPPRGHLLSSPGLRGEGVGPERL